MKRSFKVEFREDHIHVEIAPDFRVEPQQQDEFWGVIRDLCTEHDSRRVLVEGFVPEGERDTSQIIDAGMRTAVVPKMWLAFALADFEPNDSSELFEVIAASQGVRVKFFSDPQTALKWLRANSPK